MNWTADRAGQNATGWVRWKVFEEAEPLKGTARLHRLRLDLFRFLAAVFFVSLALLVLRNGLLFGTVSWDDLGNLLVCLVLSLLASRKPDWLEVHGLRVAAFCLSRLGGCLEIRRLEEGGTAVAAVMPQGRVQ